MTPAPKVPRPRDGVEIPIAEGLTGVGLQEAAARSLIDLTDPDEWDELPSLGLLYANSEDKVGVVVELPISREVWVTLEHPVAVVNWLAEVIRRDPQHPDFNKHGDLAAVWLLCEAWMSKRPADLAVDDVPLPSEDPDRIEQRLCAVVGADSNGYASLERGSTEVEMHHDADGRMINALRGLLEVIR